MGVCTQWGGGVAWGGSQSLTELLLNAEVIGRQPSFFHLRTNKLDQLDGLTDRAAVDQKASLTFQSAAAQIRQGRPFKDGLHLSDEPGGE